MADSSTRKTAPNRRTGQPPLVVRVALFVSLWALCFLATWGAVL